MLFQQFDWDVTHQVLFLYILPSHHMKFTYLRLTCKLKLDFHFMSNLLHQHYLVSSAEITENPTLKQLIYPRLHLYPYLRWVVVRAPTSTDAEDYS